MFLHLVLLVSYAAYASAVESKFTQAEKDAILKVHNDMRSSLALGNYTAKGVKLPSATNMKKLVWSDEVASMAQEAAEPCVFKHSNTGNGENIYAITKNFAGIGKAASELWESEFERFGKNGVTLNKSEFKKIGHASQMAWATTEKLGCGLCDGKKSNAMVFCQYSPPGNYIGSDMYEAGKTCSNCEQGFSCEKKTGLCVKQ